MGDNPVLDGALLAIIGKASRKVDTAIAGSEVTGGAVIYGKFETARLSIMGEPTATQRETLKKAFGWTEEEFVEKEAQFCRGHTSCEPTRVGFDPETRPRKPSRDAVKEVLKALKKTMIHVRSPVPVAVQKSYHAQRELAAACLVNNNASAARNRRILAEDIAGFAFGNHLQSNGRPPSTQEKRRPAAINGDITSRKRTRRNPN